jgi:anaerobic magnesium-protoporphyrin IX monomethyl ester cyclase
MYDIDKPGRPQMPSIGLPSRLVFLHTSIYNGSMRLLLVNAIHTKRQVETSLQPIGLAYLASYLRTHVDTLGIRIANNCSERMLHDFRPDIVGISSVTQNFGLAKRFARMCKAAGSFVITGGVHLTLLPHNLTPDMDIGVIGEGEETLLEIVEKGLKDGFEGRDFEQIRGIVFRDEDGSLRNTMPRERIQPLDKLPFPARDLLYKRTGNIHLISSRGCPFQCRFCSSSQFWGHFRAFSPSYVVEEIRSVMAQYRPDHISFWDDLFVADKQRLKGIVSEIRGANIHTRVAFSVACRADLVDEEVVDLLRQMNVTHVSMGLESGSDKILRDLKGAPASVKQNARAIGLLDKEGILVIGSFCIGSPQERVEDLEETLRFIKRMPLAKVGIFVLTPLPGTDLWEKAKEAGQVSDDMDWETLFMDLNHNPKKVVISHHIPRETLTRWYGRLKREAFRKRLQALARRLRRNPGSLPSSAHRRLNVLKDYLTTRFLS